jgi:CheY-like chemotaxis protein
MVTNRPILHVEDRTEDVFLLRYAFERAQIENPIQVVPDGQQAIEYLSGTGKFSDRDRFPLPCLVLLDLKLPLKMGLEVLEWIREQPSLKWLIVIVLTSSIYEGDIVRAYELCANAFLVKPSGMSVTIDMCKAIKHFWLVYNHSPFSLWEVRHHPRGRKNARRQTPRRLGGEP